MHKVFIAGPVLRSDSPLALAGLYGQMEHDAWLARVEVLVPRYDERLARAPADRVDTILRDRIGDADSLVAMIDAPGTHDRTNLAVAGEAQWAAELHKPIAIVALEPAHVPRMLQLITRLPIESLRHVDYQRLFRALVAAEEEPMPPLAMT
jgi:hypothetical protein